MSASFLYSWTWSQLIWRQSEMKVSDREDLLWQGPSFHNIHHLIQTPLSEFIIIQSALSRRQNTFTFQISCITAWRPPPNSCNPMLFTQNKKHLLILHFRDQRFSEGLSEVLVTTEALLFFFYATGGSLAPTPQQPTQPCPHSHVSHSQSVPCIRAIL